MRIKMEGTYSLYEFLEAMDRIAQSLRGNGVTQIRGANLYFHPFYYEHSISYSDMEGNSIETLTHHNRYAEARCKGDLNYVFEVVSPRLQPLGR